MKGIPWLREWSRDAGILLFSQGTVLAGSWILSIFVARHLGPAQFGIFAACFGVAQVFSILVDAGLGSSILREMSMLEAHAGATSPNVPGAGVRPTDASRVGGELISSAIAMTLGLTGALTCVAFTVTILAGFEVKVVGALTCLVGYTGLATTAVVAETAFRARREVRRVAAATVVDKVVLAAGVVVTLLTGGGVLGIALSYLAGGITRLGFDAMYGVAVGSLRLVRPRIVVAKKALRTALPFAMNSGATIVAMRLDAVVIAAAASASAAGFYAVGDRILLMLLFIPLTASTTLYPFLARDKAPATGMRVSIVLGMCAAGIAVVIALVAPLLVPSVFGQKYEAAVTSVQVMVFALPFVAMASGMSVALFARRRERVVLWTTAPPMLAGTVGIAIAAATWGVEGAAGAYVARAGITTGLLAAVSKREERRPVARLQESDNTPGQGMAGVL